MKVKHSEPFFFTRNKLIGFMILFLLAYFVFDGPFCYSSVCTQCGMRRYSRDWMVPFTRIKIGSVNNETDTPLSSVLSQKNIVPAHSHQWLFIHGSGNGIMCAHGSGSTLMNSTNEKVANIISLLHDRGQIEFRDRLLSGLLDHKTSGLYRGAIYDTPPETITDAELKDWIDKHSEYIDDLLRVQ